MKPTSERGPLPHDYEAERAFLGGILLNPGSAVAEMDLVSWTDFFLPIHQLIYRHMLLLKQREKPTNDSVLLYDSIGPTEELEAAGGAAFISRLPDGLPKASNLAHYAEIIKTKSVVRQRLYLAESICERLAGVNGNALEVLREVSALSAPLREEVAQKRILGFKTGLELASESEQAIAWIVRGFIARGAITELGAKVKAGKTTLVATMVRAILDGLPFLEQPTLKTPVVYLTEQPAVSFREAMKRADLLGRADFVVLSHSEIKGPKWPEVAAAATAHCKHIGAALLVVDTLPQFAGLVGDSENNSGDALAAMQPIQQTADAGIGVVLIRHERKSGGDVGDSGRGSSAFAGAVDIVLSLRKPEGNSPKTRRLLQSLSRFTETPSDLLIDLTEAGYIALGEPHDAAIKDAKDTILTIAPKTETEAMDLTEISKNADISRRTAQRAIDELRGEGMLSRIGAGKKGKPFRYFLPEIPFCATSNIGEQKSRNQDPGFLAEDSEAVS